MGTYVNDLSPVFQYKLLVSGLISNTTFASMQSLSHGKMKKKATI